MTSQSVDPLQVAEPIVSLLKCQHGVAIPKRLESLGVSDWCSICKSEIPTLDKHYGVKHGESVVLPSNLSDLFNVWKESKNPVAFERLYYAVSRIATNVAKKMFFKQDNIPDWHAAAHDAAIDCLLKLKTFNGQSEFSTWVYVVCQHTLDNWVSRDVDTHSVTLDDPDNPIDVPDHTPSVTEKIMLKEIRSLLSAEDLKLFEMKASGMTFEAIGEALGIVKSSAYARYIAIVEKILLMGTNE